jgi:hypothetical protein
LYLISYHEHKDENGSSALCVDKHNQNKSISLGSLQQLSRAPQSLAVSSTSRTRSSSRTSEYRSQGEKRHLCWLDQRLVQTIFFNPLCSLLGVISQNDICSSSLEACQRFHDDILFIQPSLLTCSLDHGIFPRDVVGSNWQW